MLYSDVATFVGQTPTTTLVTTEDPAAGSPAFYRVFGRSDCTGLSVP